MEIVLASGSARKREIMEKSGIPFRVEVPEVDESFFDNLPAQKKVEEIARAKAIKAAEKFPQDLIIASASLSKLSDKIVLGKPKDLKRALKMAMKHSAKQTTCYTAVCLIHPQQGEFMEMVETKFKFQPFTRVELKPLVDEQFLQRAGALGITEETSGYTLVESISGSYSGAFGLPMEIVRKYLKKWELI
ncbi:MAG TPA: Maf family protein [Clostridia bacterium]|nr:Maf family protein [Clostridia bacterium]